MTTVEFENYLHHHGLDSLSALFIKRKDHPSLPLCILDYDQFESPKFHPVVEKCRGIIVHRDTLKVVGKSFDRFYNVGEGDRLPAYPCATTEKLDGSLCIVYNFDGEWLVNSRFSWGDFYFEGAPHTFSDSVKNLLRDQWGRLDTNFTYLFEYMSPYNQVVVHYPEEKLSLIGLTAHGVELSNREVDEEAARVGLDRPKHYKFQDDAELRHFIDGFAHEGVVIEPGVYRLKLKTESYLRMHKLKSGLSGNLSCFLGLWANGEVESTLFLLPQYTEKFRAYQTDLDGLLEKVHNVYREIAHIVAQKDFAHEALKYPFSSMLFHLRKGKPLSEMGGLANVLERVLTC